MKLTFCFFSFIVPPFKKKVIYEHLEGFMRLYILLCPSAFSNTVKKGVRCSFTRSHEISTFTFFPWAASSLVNKGSHKVMLFTRSTLHNGLDGEAEEM